MNSTLPEHSETRSDAGITAHFGDIGNASNTGVVSTDNEHREKQRDEEEQQQRCAVPSFSVLPPKRSKRLRKHADETSSDELLSKVCSDEKNESKISETNDATRTETANSEQSADGRASRTTVIYSEKQRVKSSKCLQSKLLRRTLRRVLPYSRRFMDRMRTLSNEYITSDQAKRMRTQRCNQLKTYLKAFLTHLFSTAGLCALTVGYSLLGAVLFQKCEHKSFEDANKEAEQIRENATNFLWNVTYHLNIFDEEEWKQETMHLLEKYEKLIIKSVQEKGYRGVDASEWTFPSALLYAITVITTIGYGNLTPHTMVGRLATMLYAVIGIPIMLLCLTNLGNIMAKTFRFSYKKICCCFCCSRSTRKPQTIRTQIIELENRERNNETNVNTSNASNELTTTKVSPNESDTNSIITTKQPSQRSPVHSVEQQSIIVLDTGDDIDDSERVPVWLVSVLVIGYIWGGGWMFSVFEEWDNPFIGAYFCFISLSTIGFGDYVPSKTVDPNSVTDNNGQLVLIAVCFYLVFGLSLIAMSFNLVQEEILLKVRRIAQRVGIVAHRSN